MFELKIHYFRSAGRFATLEAAISAAPNDGHDHLIVDRSDGGWNVGVRDGRINYSEHASVMARLAAKEPQCRAGKYGPGHVAACELADRKFLQRRADKRAGRRFDPCATWEHDFHVACMSLIWRGAVESPPGENICPAMGY